MKIEFTTCFHTRGPAVRGRGRSHRTTTTTTNLKLFMKTKIIFLALALSASACLLPAQDGNPPRDGERPPPRERGRERGGERPGPAETLTDAQKAEAKAILSKFDANALTAETARATHETFQQAGPQPGRRQSATKAGFGPTEARGAARSRS